MNLGMVGLGKMGGNMVERLQKGGHHITAYDKSEAAIRTASGHGAQAATSLQELCKKLAAPRAIWVMVPSGAATEETLNTLADCLQRGDTLIDGGNSNFQDSIRRAKTFAERGIAFVDVGTSGGIWGLTEGYSMMIGGTVAAVEALRPIFETLAPGKVRGWGRVGPSGSGHFVKMVHNGIEYGLMQAFAEGFNIMQAKKEFQLDLQQIGEIWRQGSVVRSWLLDLLVQGLHENPTLEGIGPSVSDSGEGRWTVAEAIALDVPAPIITLSLLERLRSRQENSLTYRLLSLMRNKFGGHSVTPPSKR
jgi:6-phosphogluconate dehydrogenase